MHAHTYITHTICIIGHQNNSLIAPTPSPRESEWCDSDQVVCQMPHFGDMWELRSLINA